MARLPMLLPKVCSSQEREKYVKLISSDDVEFFVEKKAASVSSTIKQMLTSDGKFLALL